MHVWCLYEDGGWHVGTYETEAKLLEDAARYVADEEDIFNKYAPKDENGDTALVFDGGTPMDNEIKALNKRHGFKPESGEDKFAGISDYNDSFYYEKVVVH